MIRPASHAGSWYSAHSSTLAAQINGLLDQAGPSKPGARVLVAPHAGYTYCGQQLAQAYGAWDTRGVERVVILGPSHHVYFKEQVLLSRYASYATPLGPVPVDTEANAQLAGGPVQYMSQEADDDEHSFEMHMPFLVAKCQADGVRVPKIVPVMVSALSDGCREEVVERLAPYMADPCTTVVVSSDFCHWGRRFGYTAYASATPIFQAIEALDRRAMHIASTGSLRQWDAYIAETGNTICGQKPISIVLAMLAPHARVFQWLGYAQSNRVERASDSSVSYAAGVVQM